MTVPSYSICVNCGHEYSLHTLSMNGCFVCVCGEFHVPRDNDSQVIPVDRALLAEVYARLSQDWTNAALSRRISGLLHPVPEELTLREKLRHVLDNSMTRIEAVESIIDIVRSELVRTPAGFSDFRGNAMERDAFYYGVGRMRDRMIAALAEETNDD